MNSRRLFSFYRRGLPYTIAFGTGYVILKDIQYQRDEPEIDPDWPRANQKAVEMGEVARTFGIGLMLGTLWPFLIGVFVIPDYVLPKKSKLSKKLADFGVELGQVIRPLGTGVVIGLMYPLIALLPVVDKIEKMERS